MDHVQLRLDLLFFIGYRIDEELPWHSTISRTRQLYGEGVFRTLFKRVLSLCVKKGMVSGKRQAVDSAYIKANASMDSLIEKEVLEDADVFSDELSQNEGPSACGTITHKMEPSYGTPADKASRTVSASKKQQVDWHHSWKEEAYKGGPGAPANNGRVDEDGNPIRPKFVSNHTHYSATDSDARISVKPGKPRQLNYTAQVSVDTASHVITNMMADYSDKRDSQSVPRIVKQTIENLQENDLAIEQMLMDTGYSSGEALQCLEDYDITGYVPNFGQYKAERPGFTYHKDGDYYQCQRGIKLPFKKIKESHDGAYRSRSYRSSSKDCRTCPLRSECIGKADFKKIDDSVDKPLYDRMHQRMQTKKAKRMVKLRSATVEPVLGTLINFTGLRRIWTRGIEAAGKFMLGAAIPYNLKKWLNYRPRKVKVQAVALSVPGREKVRVKSIRTAENAALEHLLAHHPLCSN